MSLIDNITDVAFNTQQPVDKIVRIFSGTYNSTDLVAIVGTIATIHVYKIAHNLPRPVACEMIWSSDGGVTWEDGGVNSLAYSDNTYIYIFHGTAASGPIQYKVYCSWIDDYDNTNPFIDTKIYNDNPIQFDSRLNYQKIKDQNILSFTPGTFGITETQTVIHNLGYTPNTKVYFEAFANQVWPLNAGGASNPFSYDFAQDECRLIITSSTITIRMDKFSNATRRAWYRIYYDAN